MTHVSLRDARKQLGRLLDAAARGESVVITRRGRAMAQLSAVAPSAPKKLPDLTGFRASLSVNGKPLSRIVQDHRNETRY